jgi:hypothetical protein
MELVEDTGRNQRSDSVQALNIKDCYAKGLAQNIE